MSARGLAAALGILGLAVSIYLTAAHYWQASIPLVCTPGEFVNCEVVTSSSQSMLGPVPVAVLGVGWFITFLIFVRLESAGPQGRILALQAGWSALGLGFVFYLLYSELFLIGAICLWCTFVHIVTAILFLISLYRLLGYSSSDASPLDPLIEED